MIDRRGFICTTAIGLLAVLHSANSQQPVKLRKIGYLTPSPGPMVPSSLAVFTESLRELGWIEGKNVIFEFRFAANRLERLPELAAELVRLNVDVILANGTLAPLALKRATTTIPIVLWNAGDPVGSGLVTNLARPEGNITGLTLNAPELAGKRLQLLKELLPDVARVAVLWNAANPYSGDMFKQTEKAARTLGIEIQPLEVRGPEDSQQALEIATRHGAKAVIIVEDPLTFNMRTQLVDLAARNRLPMMYGLREFVDEGGLIAYGANLSVLMRRAIGYVDKILRGAKPGDLPVEQPSKFDMVINLKTAKALGITVPQSLLLRADEVIQ